MTNPRLNPIRAVVFDMDGTLFDTEKVFYAAYERALADQNIGLDEAFYHRNLAGTTNRNIECHFETTHGDRFDLGHYQEAWPRYLDEQIDEHGLPFMPEIPELLDALKEKDMPLAVASSSDLAEINRFLAISETRDYFTALVGGDEVSNSKPAPDIYLLAAQRLVVPPTDCLAIEDSNHGVLAASQAGMQVIMTAGPGGASDEARAIAAVPDSLLDFTLKQLS